MIIKKQPFFSSFRIQCFWPLFDDLKHTSEVLALLFMDRFWSSGAEQSLAHECICRADTVANTGWAHEIHFCTIQTSYYKGYWNGAETIAVVHVVKISILLPRSSSSAEKQSDFTSCGIRPADAQPIVSLANLADKQTFK